MKLHVKIDLNKSTRFNSGTATLTTISHTIYIGETHQVIQSHGNPQMRRTLFDSYLFKYCSVKYQTFHQVSEKTSQQIYSFQKTTWKAFWMPPRAMKHQLTCPIELTSGSFLIGRRDTLAIPRNRQAPSVPKRRAVQINKIQSMGYSAF